MLADAIPDPLDHCIGVILSPPEEFFTNSQRYSRTMVLDTLGAREFQSSFVT